MDIHFSAKWEIVQKIMATVPQDILAHIQPHRQWIDLRVAQEMRDGAHLSVDGGLLVVSVLGQDGSLNPWRMYYHMSEGVCYTVEHGSKEVWRKVPRLNT